MLKTKAKYLIAILLFLVALILFNTNTVNAVTHIDTSKTEVIVPNEIEKDVIFHLNGSSENSVKLELDPFILWNLSKNVAKLNTIVNADGYVYQDIYVKTEDNIVEVINKNDNSKMNIVKIDEKNYIQFNVPILVKTGNDYLPKEYRENYNLIFKDDKGAEIEEKFEIFSFQTEGKGYSAYLEIVDKYGNYIGTDNGKMMAAWRNGSQTQIFTSYDYSEAYYRLALSQNVGDSIYIDKIGTLQYTGQEDVQNMKSAYVYKMKITDTSMFNKQQNRSFLVEIIDKDTKQGAYNEIEFIILGDTRQTYTVNDDSKNIGISLNAATDIGVSLKADTIDENNNTYNVIADNKDYIWIGAYDIKLVGGNYEGDLLITFDVGTENNGKKVYIWHKLNNGNMESFNELVENGKVTIKVTELSPFLLAYEGQATEQIQQPTNNETNTETTKKGEKDETPKTGNENINIILGTIILIIFVKIITKIVKNKRSK